MPWQLCFLCAGCTAGAFTQQNGKICTGHFHTHALLRHEIGQVSNSAANVLQFCASAEYAYHSQLTTLVYKVGIIAETKVSAEILTQGREVLTLGLAVVLATSR